MYKYLIVLIKALEVKISQGLTRAFMDHRRRLIDKSYSVERNKVSFMLLQGEPGPMRSSYMEAKLRSV